MLGKIRKLKDCEYQIEQNYDGLKYSVNKSAPKNMNLALLCI